MSYASTSDPMFLETLRGWFQTQNEILVLIRYSHAAGAKDFLFFNSINSLIECFSRLPTQTCVIAFKEPQLPIRGEVNESLSESCLAYVSDGTEFLLLETTKRQYGSKSWFHWCAGDSRAELQNELLSSTGRKIAFGLYPPWLEDNDNVISAVVPDENGLTHTGVY
jgi:hypothetical protein